MALGSRRSGWGSLVPVGPLQAVRWAGFLVKVSTTAIWAVNCYMDISRGMPPDERKGRRAIDRLVAEVERRDPEAAAQIRATAKARQGNQKGLARALLFQEKVNKERGPLDLAGQLVGGVAAAGVLARCPDQSGGAGSLLGGSKRIAPQPSRENRNGWVVKA
jgi:hypothetical protein